MAPLTINEAATTTGWSARMLRYVETLGLVEPARSDSGYRLYGPPQLHRLRSLRALLDEHDLELADVATASRLRRDPAAATALAAWFDAPVAPSEAAARPVGPTLDGDWLAFEQDKHQHLLHP